MVIYSSIIKFTTSNNTFDVFNFQYLFLFLKLMVFLLGKKKKKRLAFTTWNGRKL